MKATKLAFHQKQGDDLLDIGVWQMVTKVYECKSFGTEFVCIQQGLSPVTHCHRIEIGLKRLVFYKHFPVTGKRGVNFLETFQRALKGLSEIQLSRKGRSIRQPHRYGFRSELFPVINHFEVVVDSL